MTPDVPIVYSQAIQFVIAVDSVVARPEASLPKPPTTSVDWSERTRTVTTPFERSDLEHLFSPTSTALFLFHLIIRNGWHQVERLIEEIESMKDLDLQGLFKQLLQFDTSDEGWLTPERIEAAIEADRDRETVSFRTEAEQLTRLLSAPDAFKAKLVEVLRWFDGRVFSRFAEDARARVEAWITKSAAAIVEGTEESLDQLTRGNYRSLLVDRNTVRLFPVVDSVNSATWLMLPSEDEAYHLFDIVHADRVLTANRDSESFKSVTDESIEALADPKRIAILRLLRQRPHFSKEIADHIGISASTVSYHIDKLVAARLIHLEKYQGRRFYYAINHRGVRELIDRLAAEFLGEAG